METVGKWALVTVQLAGVILSALLVIVTFANPQQVEERLQSFVIAKVEAAAEIAWQEAESQIGAGGRAEKLAALAQRFGLEANEIDAQRKQLVPALLAPSQADRCHENCDFWAAAALLANATMIEQAAQLRVGQTTLQEFVAARYETKVRGLIADLRRIGMVNVVALSLMIGLVAFRNHLNWRFTALSVAITGYTAWAAYGYPFNQN